MTWLDHPPLNTVFRRRENEGEPVDDRRLRARIADGRIDRIGPGSFAPSRDWSALTPMARHAQRVWEASARSRPGTRFALFAAAALHGIDILGPWPDRIDVMIDSASGGRSSGRIRRHARDLSQVRVQPWGDDYVTTPLQTVLDLTAALRFSEGVAVADQALWLRRASGPMVARSALVGAATVLTGAGSARALRAATFASGLSDSVRESQSRALIHVMGFPRPELQARFVLPDGRIAHTDFFWREHGHIGEFDGLDKYRDPAMLRGRRPEQILLAEKDREDALRRQVRAFSRWRTPDLVHPRRLFDILTAAGLPADRPRPGR